MSDTRWSEIDDADEEPDKPERLVRPIVWIISFFVVVVLIGIPVMRAVNYSRAQDPERAAGEARAHVAGQFALAALERRSTRQAEQWAVSGLHESIDAVVYDLQLRESAELADATVHVTRESCAATSGDPTAECFLARLVRPDGRVVTRVNFTVAIVDGRARVVSVGASA